MGSVRPLSVCRRHVNTRRAVTRALAITKRYSGPAGTRLMRARDRIIREARQLNEALGYDMNTVEFAVSRRCARMR